MRRVGMVLLGAFGLFGAYLLLFGLRDIISPQPCSFLCFSTADKLLMFALPGLAAMLLAAFATRSLWRRPSGGGRPAAVILGVLSAAALWFGTDALLTQLGPDAAYGDSEAMLFLPAGLVGAVVALKLWSD